jgi:chemotaxis protein MotB
LGKKKQEADHENEERWLLTYADLITLLLAFFIIMYSMSKLDAKKFGAVAKALQEVLHGRSTSVLKGEASLLASPPEGGGALKIGDLKLLQSKINSLAKDMGMKDKISADMDSRGLVIRISESAFFDAGFADLKPDAMKVLDAISVILKTIPNHIRFEGHTDNTPINTPKFPSNWELSVSRATTCVRYLIEHHEFPPDKISALGYGEYRPLASNNTAEGRAKNRRVDIVVLSWENRLNEPKAVGEEDSVDTEKISSIVADSTLH